MVTNITPGAVPAIDPRYAAIRMSDGSVVCPDVVVMLTAEQHSARYRGELQQWTAKLGDTVLASGQHDPEHNACRVLFAAGIKGTVLFVHAATGIPGLAMDIERGAGLTTVEGKGLRVLDYVPFSARRPLLAPDDAPDGVPTGEHELREAERRLTALADEIFNLTDEEKALLDGEARS